MNYIACLFVKIKLEQKFNINEEIVNIKYHTDSGKRKNIKYILKCESKSVYLMYLTLFNLSLHMHKT